MSHIVDLSENQRGIVYSENGPIYVKASAGSGKTRVLTERVRYLIGQTKKKVLALTFTNKAGEEITARLADIQEIEKRTFIGTFHSFCQEILLNHGSLIGLNTLPHIFEKESDRLELIEDAIEQTPSYRKVYEIKEEKEKKSFRYRALNFISKVKRDLILDSELQKHTDDENLVLLYQNYQDLLRNQNAIDFDDLLLFAYNLLINHDSVASLYRRSFSAICVDEAQDLNNAQYKFLLAFTNGAFNNVMMVGDPNQSIFHFNGSDPKYMNKFFVKDFKPKIIELKENYRSSRSVLEAASKIISDSEGGESNVIKEGDFHIEPTEDETEEAIWVAGKIKELISAGTHKDIEGDIVYEKVAILARNKYVFKDLEKIFKEENILYYYKMSPGAISFESNVMKVFDLTLRIKLNPHDLIHKEKLLDLINIDKDNSKGLKQIPVSVTNGIYREIINLTLDLEEDGSNLKSKLVNFRNNLNVQDENEKSMVFNDIDELLNHWKKYAIETDNKNLLHFKNSMALGQTQSLKKHEGITLSTVHTMKGQEFDIVFIIGLDQETFPDYRAVKSGGIDLIQEKNNLYVAFTRSRRLLYVTWPKKREMPWGGYKNRKRSQFLEMFD